MKPGHTKKPIQVLRIVGKHNDPPRVIRGETRSIDFEECSGITILDPQIVGGLDNIRLTRCTDITICGGTLKDPTRTSDDPDDPTSHNVIFDKCTRCLISLTECTASKGKPRGDAVNLFNCSHCEADGVVVAGSLAKMATAAIIDGPSGADNVLRNMVIKTKAGRVGIRGGHGHRVVNIAIPGALEVSGESYKGAHVSGTELIRVTGPELYVHHKTADEPVKTDCHFDQET